MEQFKKIKTGLFFDDFNEALDFVCVDLIELNQERVVNFICGAQELPEKFDLERLQMVGFGRFGAIMGRLIYASADCESGVIWIDPKELEKEFLKEIFYQVVCKNGDLKAFDNAMSLEQEKQIVAHVIKVFAMPYLEQQIQKQVKQLQSKKD